MTDDELRQMDEELSRSIATAMQQVGKSLDHQVAMPTAKPDGLAWPLAIMLGMFVTVLAGVVGAHIVSAEGETDCLREAVGK